eukprot:1672616-Amphidinium_carterae.1
MAQVTSESDEESFVSLSMAKARVSSPLQCQDQQRQLSAFSINGHPLTNTRVAKKSVKVGKQVKSA